MVAAAAVFATTATAQTVGNPADNSEDVILGAWSDPAKCNRANAIHLTFDDVLRRGEGLNGTCVAFQGFWAGRALFKRASQGNADGSNSDRSLRGHRIGIYAREEVLEHAPQRAARYTMVGIIGQCETEWPRAMMVLGYCHYPGGPILKIAEVIASSAANGS
ncbi:hypothetical protein ASE49_15070 [Novosphingobium sp. Leaf2]|nr:hypothetical protein ASE49_15070 [Novosphingobium sp. Leaf2]